MRAVRCVVLILLVAVGGRASAAPEAAPGRCSIEGSVRQGARSSAARIEVRRRLENPRYPHGFHRTAEHTERCLLAPRFTAPPDVVVAADAEGKFVVRGLAPARYDVLARGADGAWAGVLVPLDVDGQRILVTLALAPASERLTGRLRRADGTPFRGLLVVSRARLAVPDDEFPQDASERWAETDAEGRFALDGLAPGDAFVSVLVPGKLRRALGQLTLPAPAPFDGVVDAVEQPMGGRVTDIETREPIAGAEVVWQTWETTGTSCGVERTGADGTYTLPSPPGIVDCVVRKRGYAGRSIDGFGGADYSAVLRRASRIEGRVVGPDGRPVGAGVVVRRAERNGYWYQWTRALTDADGRFVLEDLGPGEGSLWARGNGWVPATLDERGVSSPFADLPSTRPSEWTVEPGAMLEVVLHVVPAAALVGRVLDADGKPLAGVPIHPERTGGDPDFGWTGREPAPIAASGEDGTFLIEGLLPDREYELRARPSGGAPVNGEGVARVDPARREPIVLRLPPPHWIHVRVVDRRTQKPIPGARVSFMRNSRDERAWRTDAQGLARVGPLDPPQGTLDIYADGYIDANQRGAPAPSLEGADVTVALDPELTITGRVVLADGGPAPDAIVYVANLGDDLWQNYRGSKRCEPDGSFLAERVNDIDYQLKAVLWRGTERFEAVAVAHGGARDVLLTLQPAPEASPDPVPESGITAGGGEVRPTRVTLRVVDAAGRPVPKAQFDGPGSVHEGAVTFDKMPDRSSPIRVWGAAAEDGVPLPLGPLDLPRWPAGDAETVTVVLPPERVLEGRTVDAEGKPQGRVELRAIPASACEGPEPCTEPIHGRAVSRADGSFRIGGLGDLEYQLLVGAPRGWLAPRGPIRAKPGTEVTVTLRRAHDAVVTVQGHEGHPQAGVPVEARRHGWTYFWRHGWSWSEETVATATTDASGRAMLGNLDPQRPHRLLVNVGVPDSGIWFEAREGWIPADVTVRLASRSLIRGRVEGHPAGRRPAGSLRWRQAGAWVVPSSTGIMYDPMLEGEIAEDGTFALALPAIGDVELWVGAYLLRAPLPGTHVLRTRTGATDVVLTYERGAGLAARCPEFVPGEQAHMWWGLMQEGPVAPGAGRVRFGSTSRTAERLFEGLDPNHRYTLLAIAGDRCGRVSGVAPGGEPVVVPLAPGRALTVRAKAAGPIAELQVVARFGAEGPRLSAQTDGEVAVLRGLPEGRWRVEATGVVRGEAVAGAVEADAGAAVEVVLEPR